MKHGKNKALTAPMALLAVLFVSCATTENRVYASFTVNGMAYGHSGSAVNGMEIKLGSAQAVKSDYSGRFSIPEVKPGGYRLVARMDGYEPFEGEIRVSSPADIVYLSVFSLSDLLRAAQEAMRSGEWAGATAFADRALAIETANPRALFLKALILSSALNPARDLDAALETLDALAAIGIIDPSAERLRADIEEELGKRVK